MKKFKGYINDFDIYNDDKEKEDIIKRCVTDFWQLEHFDDLKVEADYNHIQMKVRSDEVKQSLDIKDVLKNTKSTKDNFVLVENN